ncbi:putative retrotransposon hot spot protein (RHS) [Trypanosoma cruzi]|uniref:Putative retrotransposon hot spot protein (RHS) n=1 Tax=Trypanosoma cruzi TaxID=5693 RepID=A0A2V2WL36_TRYCR|nr:putative retrotransposon hot spot protein (RHS) [Trypanosoma cruzi]
MSTWRNILMVGRNLLKVCRGILFIYNTQTARRWKNGRDVIASIPIIKPTLKKKLWRSGTERYTNTSLFWKVNFLRQSNFLMMVYLRGIKRGNNWYYLFFVKCILLIVKYIGSILTIFICVCLRGLDSECLSFQRTVVIGSATLTTPFLFYFIFSTRGASSLEAVAHYRGRIIFLNFHGIL